MDRSSIDWRYALRHTLLPAATAAIAMGILAVSIWMHREQSSLLTEINVNQGVMHEDYDALVQRRRLVDRYHRRYERFYDLGFVGEESRLDWVETLRESSADLTLPRVSYAIEPQLQVVAPVQSIMAGEEIQIHLSRLQLEVGLVHELDLLRLIDEVQRNAPGLIKVDSCNLAWQAESAEKVGVGANILANCSLLIFSVVTSDVGQTGAPS